MEFHGQGNKCLLLLSINTFLELILVQTEHRRPNYAVRITTMSYDEIPTIRQITLYNDNYRSGTCMYIYIYIGVRTEYFKTSS